MSEELVAEETVDAAPPGADLPPLLIEAARRLTGRTVWHVNTTALGGGVAELLRATVPQHHAAGVVSRWLVTRGNPEFFELTKQLHHMLHGMPGNGRTLGMDDEQRYAATTVAQAEAMLRRVKPGDLAVLHDPQTLGLAPLLRGAGLHVIWRSHIGTHRRSPLVAAAWRFLGRYTDAVDELVFSSPIYPPAFLAGRPVTVIHPAIDPIAAKCRPMGPDEVASVLDAIGLQDLSAPSPALGIVTRARLLHDAPLPADAPTVVQLSRWDPLKDMLGVLRAFTEHVAPATSAHLVLAGPDPDEVADDLENRAVLSDVAHAVAQLPKSLRRRIHLLVLSLRTRHANALIVNALQRRATVVTQKSLEEGFGLAVTEAMHKRRPIVAGDVGGIREQMVDRRHGLLVPPHNLAAFGAAVRELLDNPALAARLAKAGGEHCERHFLVVREHEQYAQLFLRSYPATTTRRVP
ncbi:MAG: glycosyltransferase [Pseudonocardiaceae bacterium]